MNFGIFGGSFDPPHEGHRSIAQAARDTLHLDTLLWVPAPDPPHKAKPTTPFEHRLAMVRLAIADLPGHEASGIEATLSSPSYSIQTVAALKAIHGPGHAWFFLIGGDNWDIIQTWRQWEDLLKEVTMVVYPREGRSLDSLPAGVIHLDMPEFKAASSEIRREIASSGHPEIPGVLPSLRTYIHEQGLYDTRKAA